MLVRSCLLLVSVLILLCQVEQVSSDAGSPQVEIVDALQNSSPPTPIATLVDDNGHPQGLYSYFSKGSIPAFSGQTGRVREDLCRSAGRLDVRQTPTCDPGYVLTCPLTETKPCCPQDHPICCVNNGGCCAANYFCAGTVANPICCTPGQIDCFNGSCCDSGTTCCGTSCCLSGYTCVQGVCINPLLSSMSEQSIASIQSVSSISSQSVISAQSVASASSFLASLSSELVTQSGYSNSDTVRTVHVRPYDARIKYDNGWETSDSNTPVGACTNRTKVTKTAGAKFTFVFRGTAISISFVPSSAGGRFAVAVDGGQPRDYVSTLPSGTTSDKCFGIPIFSTSDLQDASHQVVVINSMAGETAGKLEVCGINYTGKGAFGTPEPKSGPSAAVIGGSVGGVIGALLIGGIIFFMCRKRRKTKVNNEVNNGGPMGNTQMMQQANLPPTGIPYAASGGHPSPTSSGSGGHPSPTGSGHPLLSQDQHQQFAYPQQPPFSFQQGPPSHQYGQGGAPIAPLPNWIQRASQSNKSGLDTTSMSSATRSNEPVAPVGVSNEMMQQPGALYGSHYASNPQV